LLFRYFATTPFSIPVDRAAILEVVVVVVFDSRCSDIKMENMVSEIKEENEAFTVNIKSDE
jgi:hypothetical protein